MRYSIENYNKLINFLDISRKYAYEMCAELDNYKDIVKNYINDIEVLSRLDILATEVIIKQKKEIMKDHTDIYYDICKVLKYPNIKAYENDFNPEPIGYNELPKNFDIGLLEEYDRLLMRGMLETLLENNDRVTISLDISITEKELEIKKKILKLGYKYYFITLHSQGIITILS